MLIPNKHNGYSRDGRRLYYLDQGGNAPAAEQKATTELPEWAKPYAKDILAKGQALTDVNQNPYQTYNQDRIAGFSPMQQQAMQNAQGMSAAPQIGQGTAAAVGAGLGGANVAGQANQYGFQNQVGGYMNPYLQMSLAPQLAEANRNYDISGVNQQSRATQAGAFGGSREAIMAAENERNRNTGLNSIIGQGYNTAFGNAQQQYNQNLQNQIAGYGLMGSAANSLGQLGQNQYNQNMGINQLQAQYGGQQQAQMQKGLDTSYQDFLNQQNYPYKQLGFMSDLLRGTPTGSSSVTQMYQAPPSALQTVGALGMGAYGINQLSKMGANGGLMNSYASGGDIYNDSVTSEDNTEEIISTLNPQQLQNALKNAQARGDRETVAAITARLDTLAKQASMDKGIAGAMPQQMADGVVNAAGGGILAFGPGGETNDETEAANPMQAISEAMYSRGDPVAYRGALQNLSGISKRIREYNPTPYTPEDQARLNEMFFNQERRQAGPSPFGPLEEDQKVRQTDRKQAIELGKAAIAFRGMKAITKGNSAIRGLTEAAGDVGEGMVQLQEADRKEKRAIADVDFKITNAKRLENMGMTKNAQALTASAVSSKKAADKAELDKLSAEGKIEQGIAVAAKQTGKAGGSGAGSAKDFIFGTEKYLALVQANPKYEKLPLKQQEAIAFNMFQTNKPGVTAGATVKSQEDATKAFNKMQLLNRKDWKKTVETDYGGDAKAAREAWIANERGTALPNSVDTMMGNRTAQPRPAPQQTRPAPAGGTTLRFDAQGQPIQ